jgi:hypothetical protein
VQVQIVQQSTQTQTQTQTSGDAATLASAGKEFKGWAKRMWNNPTVKQTVAVVGGAVAADALGGNPVAGAQVANKIYHQNNAQKPTVPGSATGNAAGRPPGPVHAHTAPVQGHGLPAGKPPMQAPVQVYQQPMGVQTPGRPYLVQNPAMATAGVVPVQQMPPQQICIQQNNNAASVQQQQPDGTFQHIIAATGIDQHNHSHSAGSGGQQQQPQQQHPYGHYAHSQQQPQQDTFAFDNSSTTLTAPTPDSHFSSADVGQQSQGTDALYGGDSSGGNHTGIGILYTGDPSGGAYAGTAVGDPSGMNNVEVDINVNMTVNLEVDQTCVVDVGDVGGRGDDMFAATDTSLSVSEWSSTTVDYSGGDWGDEWY